MVVEEVNTDIMENMKIAISIERLLYSSRNNCLNMKKWADHK
jgi:hypothetical protein